VKSAIWKNKKMRKNNMENKFGVFIKKLRKENKYTLRNFAKVLKKSPTFVSLKGAKNEKQKQKQNNVKGF
jgi:hypothetical protein